MFKLLGFWQTKGSSWLYIFYGLLVHFVFVECHLIFEFGFLFILETFEDFANVMTLLPTVSLVCLKSINFRIYINEMEELLEQVRTIFNGSTVSRKFENELRKIEKIYKAFWGAALASCVIGAFIPFVQHILPYKMWFPWDYEQSEIRFWGYATYQIIASLVDCSISVVLVLLPVMFMVYILGMFEDLSDRLEALKSPKQRSQMSDANIHRKFLDCIEYHRKILTFTRKVEKIFSFTFFAQGIMSTIILCSIAFALTVASEYRFVCITILFNINFNRFPQPSNLQLLANSQYIWYRWLSKYFCLASMELLSRWRLTTYQQSFFIPIGISKIETIKAVREFLWST